MNPRELILLSPYRLPAQNASMLADDDTGAFLHAYTALWHPAVLRDQVITSGGVTISAIHELERHGLRAMLISAIETATRHSEERMRSLEAKTQA